MIRLYDYESVLSKRFLGLEPLSAPPGG